MTGDVLPFPDGSPWWMLPEDRAEACTEELNKEIGPLHPLYERLRHLRVIAKCDANDDVLVADQDDPDSFYLVHLTWSGKIDQVPDRFPWSKPLKRSELEAFFKNYGKD